jgi:hypothetical protein
MLRMAGEYIDLGREKGCHNDLVRELERISNEPT